jgi:hypothetical protein
LKRLYPDLCPTPVFPREGREPVAGTACIDWASGGLDRTFVDLARATLY